MVQHAFNPFLHDLCPKSPLHNIYYKKYPPQLYGIKNSDFFFQFHATRAGRKYIFEIIVMNKF